MDITGTTMKSLEWGLREFDPGQPVEVFIGIDRAMTDAEVTTFAQEVRRSGLNAQVQFGSTDQWENALRLSFQRPVKPAGIGFFPVGGVLLATAAAIGIGFVGFNLAAATKSVGEGIGRSIIPLALIAAGTIIAVAAVRAKQGRA